MFQKDRGWCDWSAVEGREWWEAEEMRSEKKPCSQCIVYGEAFGWEAIGGQLSMDVTPLDLHFICPKGLNCGLKGPSSYSFQDTLLFNLFCFSSGITIFQVAEGLKRIT